jgi:hypothetical protein
MVQGSNDLKKNYLAVDECLSLLLEALSGDPVDERKFLERRKGRQKGTCEWIKDHALYKTWAATESELLWISGGPGKGKTTLSLFLTQHLEIIAKTGSTLVYFFCDQTEKHDRAEYIL